MDTSVQVELIKIEESEKLSRKQVAGYLQAFATQIDIIFRAAMHGRELAEVYLPSRVNTVMSQIEVERCIAHFQVMDALMKKLGAFRDLEGHAWNSIKDMNARGDTIRKWSKL